MHLGGRERAVQRGSPLARSGEEGGIATTVAEAIRWQVARAAGVEKEDTAPGQRGGDESELAEGKQGEKTMAREMRRPEGATRG